MRQHKISRRLLVVICISMIAVSSGCVHYAGEGSGQAVLITGEAFKHFSGEFENTPHYKKHKPVRVAVLPFADLQAKNYSIDFEDEDPANIVRRGMYNHVSSLPFKDLEIFQTDTRLKNSGLRETGQIEDMIRDNPRKLASILGVDAVVSGQVTHWDRIFIGIYSQVAVGCEVKMWDLKTGNLLWRAKHVTRAHAGGLSLNPIGLVMSTVAAVWNLRQTELLSQTDELFREIVSTIELPESALAMQEAAPRLDLFATLNADRPFTLGQKVAFRIIGDPGCKAYVDLGDYRAGIKLNPVSSAVKQALQADVLAAIKQNYKETGHELTPELIAAVEKELATREIYEGAYTVAQDEQQYGLFAKSYLVDAGGNQKTAIDAAQTVDIDSRPPSAVAGLAASALDGKIQLNWSANTDTDLAGYEIWSSATPLSGYQLVQKSEPQESIVDDLANFVPVFFKVRAFDRAANLGEFGEPFKAIPLPLPGLYGLPQPGPELDGEITEKILLVAAKSPYTVYADLRILPGGMVIAEPGVEILFAPDSQLAVEGGDLLIYGQQGRPVRLAPLAKDSQPGSWQGVLITGAPRALLQHVVIEKAVIGLTINDSAPLISNSRITASAQAGVSLQANAKPNINCSVFDANEGQGAFVIEGEGIAPIIRNNSFVDNTPFQVQSYSPLAVDLAQNWWGLAKPKADLFLGNISLEPVLTTTPAECQ